MIRQIATSQQAPPRARNHTRASTNPIGPIPAIMGPGLPRLDWMVAGWWLLRSRQHTCGSGPLGSPPSLPLGPPFFALERVPSWVPSPFFFLCHRLTTSLLLLTGCWLRAGAGLPSARPDKVSKR